MARIRHRLCRLWLFLWTVYKIMRNRKSAGDHIDARCTRCREVTNHTIVAMIEERVVRVQCNICGGIHNYHGPKKEKESTSSKASKASPAPRRARGGLTADQREWLEFQESVDPQPARQYAMGHCYQVDELIDHPVFGLGVVRAVVKPNKMEVLFKDGRKLLRCSV
jgi:hypothetical protein